MILHFYTIYFIFFQVNPILCTVSGSGVQPPTYIFCWKSIQTVSEQFFIFIFVDYSYIFKYFYMDSRWAAWKCEKIEGLPFLPSFSVKKKSEIPFYAGSCRSRPFCHADYGFHLISRLIIKKRKWLSPENVFYLISRLIIKKWNAWAQCN